MSDFYVRGAKIIPFKKEHLELMDIRDIELRSVEEFIIPLLSSANRICDMFTVIYNGRVLMLFGINKLWEGVVDVFLVPSIYIERYAILYLRVVKELLNLAYNNLDYNVRRMQTVTISDPVHDKWMRFLGFNQEGFHPNYSCDGKDYKTWAKTKWV